MLILDEFKVCPKGQFYKVSEHACKESAPVNFKS